MVKTKLTTVNVIDGIYKMFKINTIDNDINFQKLVNRSLNLYNNDSDFRDKIDSHIDLSEQGGKF